MFKGLVRILSFVAKELSEVRRQPRLIASLILGPFLILFLFGVGYNSTQPPLRTALVIPANSNLSRERAEYEAQFQPPFVLSYILDNRDEARQYIQTGRADVALVMPQSAVDTILNGQHASMELLFNEIDPIQSGWIPYFGNVLVSELNRQIIQQAITSLQEQTRDVARQRALVDEQLQRLEEAAKVNDPKGVVQSATAADEVLEEVERRLVASVGILTGAGSTLGAAEASRTGEELAASRQDLAGVRGAAERGDAQSPEQRELVGRVRSSLNRVLPAVERLSRVPATVLSAPLQLQTQNFAQNTTFVAFFTPGVLALLLQHLALTLSSLSIVRERLLGALEVFRVAPVGKREIFAGKYISYALITLGVGAILTLLLRFVLDVPIRGSLLHFGLSILLLTLASLSLGFLISTISKSESQAVQFSMILLLASILFSGFFLPLTSLLPYVRSVSFALPVTYGILSLKDVMLLGKTPPWWEYASLLGIFAIALALATRFLQRDLARS
jgi:ABC-2 type transport system permease protein